MRHIGTPAATLAAQRLGAFADEIDGVEARHEVVRDADNDSGFAIAGYADGSVTWLVAAPASNLAFW